MGKFYNKYVVAIDTISEDGSFGYTKGDVYEYNSKLDMYVCKKIYGDSLNYRAIYPYRMELLHATGVVYADCTADKKPSVTVEIDRLLKLYVSDYTNYKKNTNFEGATVTANMIKLLNHLKNYAEDNE